MQESIDVEQQLALHQWANVIIFQSPINWMGVTWSFKKYMDEVYGGHAMQRRRAQCIHTY